MQAAAVPSRHQPPQPLNGPQSPLPPITCIAFRSQRSGNLRGFATLHIPMWRCRISNCAVFENSNGISVAMPGWKREVTREGEATQQWQAILEFDEPRLLRAFSDAAAIAVRAYAPAAFDGGR